MRLPTSFLSTGLLLLPVLLSAQFKDSINHFSRKRFNTVVIAGSAAYAGSMVGLGQAWYAHSGRQSFRFFNDAQEWKQMDKIGHFYSAFQLSSIGAHTLIWTGLDKKKSNRAGSSASFGVMSSIEIFDGFSPAYGASLSDIAANAAGSAFYLVQQKLWDKVRIYPKFSFHPTDFAAQRPNTLGNGFSQELLKDYNGQTYWLSIDADKFFPFPKWLNLAVGYGAEGMIYAMDDVNKSAGLSPYRQYYLSLDFDLTGIKSKSKLIHTLTYFVNMIRLPAPAVEFSHGGVKFHALYF